MRSVSGNSCPPRPARENRAHRPTTALRPTILLLKACSRPIRQTGHLLHASSLVHGSCDSLGIGATNAAIGGPGPTPLATPTPSPPAGATVRDQQCSLATSKHPDSLAATSPLAVKRETARTLSRFPVWTPAHAPSWLPLPRSAAQELDLVLACEETGRRAGRPVPLPQSKGAAASRRPPQGAWAVARPGDVRERVGQRTRREGTMSSAHLLFDAAARRRSPAAMPGHKRRARAPGTKAASTRRIRRRSTRSWP